MKLSEFKNALGQINQLNFIQLNGNFVPRHFHITEAGITTKNFVDCGGTVRTEQTFSMQLWLAEDFDHRLVPEKLQDIIHLAEKLFHTEDIDVDIEFQQETINRYGLKFDGHHFLFVSKQTDCLAKDHCGIPIDKIKIPMSDLKNNCCTPNSNCC